MPNYISAQQLAAGAWALTVATLRQPREVWGLGYRRPLLPNVVVEQRGLAWIADTFLKGSYDDSHFALYVDSLDGLSILEQRLSALRPRLEIDVLVEVGYLGGRTGVRTLTEGLTLAQAITDSQHLDLLGVAVYEGVMPRVGDATPIGLGDYLTRIHEMVLQGRSDQLSAAHPVVTAGGSFFFDHVVRSLGPQAFDFPTTTVLRAGCYATHVHGMYEDTATLGARRPSGVAGLTRAIELVVHVWSRSEPDLVIVGFGRRVVPIDDRLPIVLGIDSTGALITEAAAVIEAVNGQHAYMRDLKASTIGVGDIISFGVATRMVLSTGGE